MDGDEKQPFIFGSTDAMEEQPPPKKRSKLSTNRSRMSSEADRAERIQLSGLFQWCIRQSAEVVNLVSRLLGFWPQDP